MRKTIFVVLMAVMIATPCFAQDVEPEGMFSIEGTLWSVCSKDIHDMDWCLGCVCEVGFYQGKIYIFSPQSYRFDEVANASYCDLFVVSIAFSKYHFLNYFSAIISPFGIGMVSWGYFVFNPVTGDGGGGSIHGIMHKINDNWTPPEVE